MRAWKLILTILFLIPNMAFAQSRMVIGGVDTRVPPVENQYLAQQAAAAMQQAAKAAALLTIEKQDHTETQKALEAVSAYWRAWCGAGEGCGK